MHCLSGESFLCTPNVKLPLCVEAFGWWVLFTVVLQSATSMCEESALYQQMVSSYILGRKDYEDPNNLFPMKEDQRKVMRTCRRCWVLHDINFPSGRCSFHRSFFRVTVPETCMGLVIGRGGSHLKQIREKSGVSHLTIPKDEGGRSGAEIQVQGGRKEVELAFSMIRGRGISFPFKGLGSVSGSWDCCQKGIKANGCVEESNHDSLICHCFLDKSMVVTTQSTGLDGFGKVFALDCEMVNTTRGKELAWVTLLDYNGNLCYDTLVKPPASIVDCNTVYSGITPEMLAGVTTTLADVQRNLLQRVSSNDILVGHSIDSDLRCLHLEHRKVTVLDQKVRKPLSFFRVGC